MPPVKKHKPAVQPERSSPAVPIEASLTASTAARKRRQRPTPEVSEGLADREVDNEHDHAHTYVKKLRKREDNDNDDEDDDRGAGDDGDDEAGSWSPVKTSATSPPTTVDSKVKLQTAPATAKRQRLAEQQPPEPVLDLFSMMEVKADFDDELKIEEVKEQGHDSKFNILKERICALSVAKQEWRIACSEWDLENIYEHDNGECLCTHRPIRDHCVIRNRQNGEVTTVGNVCVSHFTEDLRVLSRQAFGSLKRVRKNPSEVRANKGLLNLSIKRGIIGKVEGQRYIDKWNVGRTKLSDADLDDRGRLNQKILTAFSQPPTTCPDCNNVLQLREYLLANGERQANYICFNQRNHPGQFMNTYIGLNGAVTRKAALSKNRQWGAKTASSRGRCKNSGKAIVAQESRQKPGTFNLLCFECQNAGLTKKPWDCVEQTR